MSIMLQLVVVGSVTGVAAIILGGVLGFKILPDNLEEKLQNNVRLELSEAYRKWENPPFEVKTHVYFYDVTNGANVQKGQNAIVTELGPVIYKQSRRKDKILYDHKTDSFSYDEWVSHELDTSSPVLDTASFRTLNVLKYMTMSYVTETKNTMDKVKDSFRNVFADTENDLLFHSIKVRDFFDDGYKITYTSDDMGAKILQSLITLNLKDNPRFKKSEDDEDRYHFYVYKTEQHYKENSYEVYGGQKDIRQQGQLKSVNKDSSLNVWPKVDDENYCNIVRGSDSYTINPAFDADQELTLYQDEICRFLDYAFTKKVEVRDMRGHRLILKSENFYYPEENNTNACFCVENDRGKCIESGFLNVAKCFDDLPLIVSQPHFLYADPVHAERLDFSPSVEKDVSFIDVQSESGAILRSERKTQYNIWVDKVEDFAEDIKPFMLPLFRVEEIMEMPDETVNYLNAVYFDDVIMVEGVKWGLLVAGIVLLLGSVGTFVFSKLNLNKKS